MRSIHVMAVLVGLSLLGNACGPRHQPPPDAAPAAQSAIHGAVDWASAGDEAARLLSNYLQVDTVNPPGNESRGARYLAALLASEGIESTIHEFAPNRGSLVARLPGSGGEPPLCLMSHIDVVTAEAERWPEGKAPLSGLIDDDGRIWGRGALDMKGMGAMQALSMVWLKRLEVPLKRDVILLAVADEELNGEGAKLIANEHWDEIGCSHMINEGGFGVKGALFEGQTIWAVSVAEKGFLWVRVVAEGEPGHGSVPLDGRAPDRLRRALDRISAYEPEPVFHPALYELFYRVGENRRGLERAVMTRPAAVRSLLEGRLMDNPVTRAMLINTIEITNFESTGKEPNVVPSTASAVLDIRLRPGVQKDEVLDALSALVDDEGVRFEIIDWVPGNESPWDDPLYQTLTRHLTADRSDAVAGPAVAVGFTDSIFFRPLGVRAYGMIPFEITGDELATSHGDGEYVSIENLREGLRILFATIADVSAMPGWTPPPAPLTAPPGAVPDRAISRDPPDDSP